MLYLLSLCYLQLNICHSVGFPKAKTKTQAWVQLFPSGGEPRTAGWKNEENETQWRKANPSMVHSWAACHWSSWSSASLGTHWGAMKSVPQLKDRKLGIYLWTPMSHWLKVALGSVNTLQHPGCAGPGLSGHPWPGKKPGNRIAAERHESGS